MSPSKCAKRYLVLIPLQFSFLFTFAYGDDKVKKIEITHENILRCNETLTGTEAQIEVVSQYTEVSFDGGSQSYVSKRRIKISDGTNVALSEISAPPVAADITWEEMGKFSGLSNDYNEKDGVQYQDLDIQTDKSGRLYPVYFLRLRASIPVANRKKGGSQIISHLSINLALPESRLREKDGFSASGYMNYWLNDRIDDVANPDGYTIGLANFKCQEETRKISK